MLTTPPTIPEPPFRAPPQVQQGGVLEIEVGSGVKELTVWIPGHGARRHRVQGGRVEVRVPPSVPGGTPILIGDENYPNPHAATVWVVSSQTP